MAVTQRDGGSPGNELRTRPPPRRPLPPGEAAGAWLESARILALTRALFLTVGYAAAWFLASGRGGLDGGALDIWSRWDALHFYSVAEHGYVGPEAGPHATAFFPGFPLLLRALGVAGVSPVAAGLAVAAAASLVAFAFLYRLAEQDAGRGAGRRAVVYLALFPTAVFLVAPYSEALFLAGAIPAFFLARNRRWMLAGVPAAVAVATRAAGLFLLLGLVAERLRQGDLRLRSMGPAAAGVGLGALPLVAYGFYLDRATGDPLRFFTDQRLGWGRTLTDPVTSFLNTWTTWQGADYPSNWIFAWRLEIVAAAVGLFFVGWAVAKREWGYAAYMGVTMLALLTSTWYFSIPRMLLSLFPIPLFLAEVTGRSPLRHEAALMILAPLTALGVVVFTQGAWFY